MLLKYLSYFCDLIEIKKTIVVFSFVHRFISIAPCLFKHFTTEEQIYDDRFRN